MLILQSLFHSIFTMDKISSKYINIKISIVNKLKIIKYTGSYLYSGNNESFNNLANILGK